MTVLCRGGVGCNKLESVEFPEEEARVENAGNNWALEGFRLDIHHNCHLSQLRILQGSICSHRYSRPQHILSWGSGAFPRVLMEKQPSLLQIWVGRWVAMA